MTNASEELSASTSRRSGITTLSTSAWVSMPNGPSLSVEHTISGPSANRSGASAASRLRVTVSFEFGLTTRMRGRRMDGFPWSLHQLHAGDSLEILVVDLL